MCRKSAQISGYDEALVTEYISHQDYQAANAYRGLKNNAEICQYLKFHLIFKKGIMFVPE